MFCFPLFLWNFERIECALLCFSDARNQVSVSFQPSNLSLLIFQTQHTKLLQLFLTLCYPMDHSPPDSSVPMDCSLPSSYVHGVPQEKNTGVGCYALLQGIFLTQGLNPYLLCLLHWQEGSLPTSITWEAHVCIHRCMYLCVCVCVCVCVSVYLYHPTCQTLYIIAILYCQMKFVI